MTRVRRLREVVANAPDAEYFQRRADEGWRMVAVEWAREVEGEPLEAGEITEYVPYGLRVADDCFHLVEDEEEMQVLTVVMELIVQDNPLSKVADELNRQGYRTRQGWKWGQVSVFALLPRLIEMGPRIFSSEQWSERRRHFWKVG